MATLKTRLSELLLDERGGEVLEYALVVGLLVTAALAVITGIGIKVLGRWTSLSDAM